VTDVHPKRRVLLVTSSYAPTTIADMHRGRHLAWELPKLGWDVEVLFPNGAFQRPEYLEPGSISIFNPAVTAHAVAPQDFWFFRPFKIRSIGWRALRPLNSSGAELLRHGRFDLVYISTANFNLFCLGRHWKQRFRVPYVLDYHDPWVRDRIDYATTPHYFKRWVGAVLSRWMERYAIERAEGVVAVSPVYIEELRRRYGRLPCLQPGRCEAIPFAASERDFIELEEKQNQSSENCREIVYVGAGGSIMARSFTTICAALAQARKSDPDLTCSLKIRLCGTYAYWKAGDPKPLQEIAARYGLSDIVEEIPPRITYLKAMELAQRANGLFVLGVDDAGYIPSKLFTYALSGKPLLASFRSDAPGCQLFAKMPGLGHLLTFGTNDVLASEAAVATIREFLVEVTGRHRFERRAMIREFLAPAMARRHAELFEACLRPLSPDFR
jgi:hypothetical protein